jgi:hypothetical protein
VRPRGRPPATRQLFSFEREDLAIPTELLLDTSFVAEALIVSQPSHNGALDFLVRSVAETAFQLALKESIQETGGASATTAAHDVELHAS